MITTILLEALILAMYLQVNDTDLQPINSIKMFLHLSTPCLYAGKSAIQRKINITANLQTYQSTR